MKEIEIEELRQIQIELLKSIALFCDKNGLRYFLTGGTLLGAIRHRGFIPWDDDIDIAMPREDYEVFIKSYYSEGNQHRVVTCYSQKEYYLPFAKVVDENTILIEKLEHNSTIGVFVDVFPLDRFDFSDTQINRFYKQQRRRIRFLSVKTLPLDRVHTRKKIVALILKFLCLGVSSNSIAKRIDKEAQKASSPKGEVICVAVAMTYGKKEFLKKSLFDESVDVLFQNYVFHAPKGYDEVLRRYYGDYMELPPIEKRVTHHNFKAYYKENN